MTPAELHRVLLESMRRNGDLTRAQRAQSNKPSEPRHAANSERR